MISRLSAEKYGKAILDIIQDRNVLKKVYLFGSLTCLVKGTDADLILEVPLEVFSHYASSCVGALDGFHPILNITMPMASMYWNYHSPQEARFNHATNAINLFEEQLVKLDEIIHRENIDIICLPVDWNKKGDVSKMLRKNFDVSHDPDMFDKLQKTCVEII